MRLPQRTISSVAVSRAHAISFALFAALPPVPRAAAAVADVETTLYLATLLQLRAEVAQADSDLFAGLLTGTPSVTSEEGRIALLKTSKMLKEYRPIELGRDAASTGVKARVLSRKGSSLAEGHAKEVNERLTGILENDRTTGLKRDQLNRVKAEMAPEQLRFIHNSFLVAQVCCWAVGATDAFVACSKLAPVDFPT